MDQFKGKPRLPKSAVPKRYDIKLKPDLETCKFSGAVSIDVDIVSPTTFLVLNAVDLSIPQSCISFRPLASSEFWKPISLQIFQEDEILVAEFAGALPLGIGVLCISYEGTLNDKMKGFYRSTYEIKGDKKNMAVTQFEPVDARRCFPCWDEPAIKAKFKISLDVPSEVLALSNMPVVEEQLFGQLKTVIFQESPAMSTYLVAIVIGLFDYLEDHTSDGIKIRVYTQVTKANQGKFALNVAVRTLGFYREYFGVPYALPKLDMVAIPDFAAGAMENYGLVTYRETALLYDEQHSAAVNRQRVATVVAHELAHQWFGNLVTMEWWTHLWLNEGFATWVSYLASDNLFPEWKIWTQFVDESSEGLRLDGLVQSHPIEVEVNHAAEVDEIFDNISYSKGASVIRMLQSYLGHATFQRALAAYIKRHAWSNAKTEDLWAVLDEESGEPVHMLMNSWTKQKGYPVVSIKLKDNNLEFQQSQFLFSGACGDGQWIVPITTCCGSYETRRNFLLKTRMENVCMRDWLGCSLSKEEPVIGERTNQSKNIPGFGCAWIKLNVNQTGFYRVKYDENLACRLRFAIESKQLSASDRFGVLDDYFALIKAGQESLGSLLALMGAYKEELDYSVLSNLINISYKIVRITADALPDSVDDVKKFFIYLFQYPAYKLGWDPIQGEGHLNAMLRGELLCALAVLGHDSTRSDAVRRFHAFLEDRDTPLLVPDLRKAAYVAVMQKASRSNRWGYESLLKIYRETELSQERTRILSSLASCPDTVIILEVLNFLLSSEVRQQDAVFGLHVCIEGRDVAWAWLKDNWDHIEQVYGSGFLITRFLSAVVSTFASYEKVEEIEEFFATRWKAYIARTLRQSIEQVRINANCVQSVLHEEHIAHTIKQLLHTNSL